ncbi:hypothetical protein B0H14DRAFT_2749870 [Mycena olivaceomarginata]|nr:hypothetical protein B0H14DRAFT_2749870 [Mycena olivaceomarginata]
MRRIPAMIRLTILLNPTARVWNLRFLLLWTIVIIVSWRIVSHYDPYPISLEETIAQIVLCFIPVHHLVVLIPWSLKGLALIDFGLILLEIVETIFISHLISPLNDTVTKIFRGAGVLPLVLSLILSASFRLATLIKCNEAISRQRFSFLGGCAQAHPPYTSSRILLNRSIARPLVRGESMFIILPRAVIISAIALGVPAFAVYSIIVMPGVAEVFTRSISGRRIEHGPLQPPGKATVYLGGLFGYYPSYPEVSSFNITTTTWGPGAEILDCGISNKYYGSPGIVVECPCFWDDVLNMTISLSIEQGNGAYATPLPGSLQESRASADEYLMASLFYDIGSSGVPLLSGSRLFGVVTWTRRDLIITSTWGFSPRVETIFTPDITALQPDPRNVSDPSATTLTLFQPFGAPTRRLLRETVEATALSGIATFGGFWTFLNGAFALFFGANVLYFMFGRRPLSALGLVHILQRRRLVRQWHDDFPAIHTEGGLPGSESAGIVAFIRERLVDLEQDPGAATVPPDVEAQPLKDEEGEA